MIRCSLILLLLSFAFICKSATVDSLVPAPAIPVYYPRTTQPLLSTQLSISAGTSRIGRSDRPLFSTAIECKGVYYLSGALYLSGGSGFSLMRSLARPAGSPHFEQQVFLAYAPAGIGFSIGDDRAMVITALDLLPGVYVYDGRQPETSRRFTCGFAPEFGFLFHTGRRHSRGLDIGMTGKIRFMQSPDRGDGDGVRYTFGGMGLMLRF